MGCDDCKKPKTVHLTEIKNGKQVEKHLCADCPKLQEEGMAVKSQHTPINELLTNFVMATHSGIQQQAAACENCGLTWAEFRQSGLLGCPNDYDVFERELAPLLQRAHEGATHHVGKVPQRRGGVGVPAKRVQHDLIRLRRDLADAVEREDYETAAAIRDKIKQAESQAVGSRRKPKKA
ncbi:MAG: UvrB/UvrC motif-containing protein [Phycisphaerae bacterium]